MNVKILCNIYIYINTLFSVKTFRLYFNQIYINIYAIKPRIYIAYRFRACATALPAHHHQLFGTCRHALGGVDFVPPPLLLSVLATHTAASHSPSCTCVCVCVRAPLEIYGDLIARCRSATAIGAKRSNPKSGLYMFVYVFSIWFIKWFRVYFWLAHITRLYVYVLFAKKRYNKYSTSTHTLIVSLASTFR